MNTARPSLEKPHTPVISVLMAVRDGARFLHDALDSLLAQSYPQWEAIVINDGSTDRTAHILASYKARDPRFVIHSNPTSLGLAASLNIAIGAASGDFLARMDADDVCIPERFETQLEWMKRHPTCVLLGANAIRINEQGDEIGVIKQPLTDDHIRVHMLFGNPFLHPTTLWRRRAFEGATPLYDESFETSQDWELWREMLRFGPVANIATPLLKYRVHPKSVSATKAELQQANSLRVQRAYFRDMFEQEKWDETFFQHINRVFMGDRANAPKTGPSRAEIAFQALNLARAMPVARSSRAIALPELLVERAILTGLYPPPTKSWLRLLGLVTKTPIAVIKSLCKQRAHHSWKD